MTDLNICFTLACVQVQVSARGEVTVTLPPKLELRCPSLAVANKSLELTLVSWGAVGVDVDWKITKDGDGVQVAEGKIMANTQALSSSCNLADPSLVNLSAQKWCFNLNLSQ